MRYVTHLLCLIIVSATAGIWPLGVYAQAQATPALDIIAVDRTQLPTVQLTLVGSQLPADIATLPVKLFEGDQVQTIVTDQVEQGGATGRDRGQSAQSACLRPVGSNPSSRSAWCHARTDRAASDYA